MKKKAEKKGVGEVLIQTIKIEELLDNSLILNVGQEQTESKITKNIPKVIQKKIQMIELL